MPILVKGWSNVTIKDNVFRVNAGHAGDLREAIYVAPDPCAPNVNRFAIEGNVLDGTGGIRVSGAKARICDNALRLSAAYHERGGIQVGPAGVGALICGNSVEDAPYYGIYIQAANDITISSNRITGAGVGGVCLYGPVDDLLIADNQIVDNNDYGITADGTVTNCLVVNNYVTGHAVNIAMAAGWTVHGNCTTADQPIESEASADSLVNSDSCTQLPRDRISATQTVRDAGYCLQR